jgi:putative hydrolase of the HAD superfamily
MPRRRSPTGPTRAVLFDVGGVLHNNVLPYIWMDIAVALSVPMSLVTEAWHQLIPQLGSGALPLRDFWLQFAGLMNRDPSPLLDTCLLCRSFRERLVISRGVASIICSLSAEHVPMAAVSDAVSCHSSYLRKLGVYAPFTTVVLSHKVGARKPAPVVYDRAIRALRARPYQVIYVDDKPAMVEAAQQYGLRAILYTSATDLRRVMAASFGPSR